MDPICKHPVFFDSAKEEVKRAMEQLKKPLEIFDNSLYACSSVAATMCFSVAKAGQVCRRGNTCIQQVS